MSNDPYLCDNCGVQSYESELYKGKYCQHCYGPAEELSAEQIGQDLANRIIELEEQLARQPQINQISVTPFEGLTEKETIIVKWQFNLGGGYYRNLMAMIQHSDADNKDRLKNGFQVFVEAYLLYAAQPGWWNATLAKAEELGIIKEKP